MNWHRKLLIKTAAAKSKIQRYSIADPVLKFFIHKYEDIIPWADIDAAKQKGQNPEEVINNFISSSLMPVLRAKIDQQSDDNNYVKSYDIQGRYETALEHAREDPDHPVPPELETAYQIYLRDPAGAEQKLMGIINTDKEERFKQWWNYLDEEDTYKNSPAFKYSILKPIIDSSPEKTEVAPLPLNPQAVSLIWDEITERGVNQMNVLKKYRKISNKLNEEGAHTVETGEKGNKWIHIPSKIKDPNNYKTNKAMLQSFSQGTSWCIAGERMSEAYLSKGDFWLYLENGRAVVAIRLDSNDKVLEIRGHQYPDTSGQEKLKPYWREVTEFLHNSELDFKDNQQYKKTIQPIWFMNQNLERGNKDYLQVEKLIQKDHTAYLQLSEENRQKFPEFLDIAVVGYRRELDIKLQKMEEPRITESQYFKVFEEFQDYYDKIPDNIKAAVGDLQPRIFEAHRKAYHHNPYLLSEFPPEIQQQFSPDEQKSAWEEYVKDDPYHYNDTRMPEEIKQMLQIDLRAAWIEMIKKNPLHIDYMPRKILELFQPGEIEEIVLRDFAYFPVSQIKGKLDKLERVEKLVGLGLVDRQQIIDIFKQALQQHPDWVHMIPERYREEVYGGKKLTEIENVVRDKAMHVVRHPGYFKTMPPDMQNKILEQYGADIGQAFANTASSYRGMMQDFWINVPENVRQYLPQETRDATALFYANILNKNPSNFDATFSKIPPDIQGDVWAKLASRMSWYKKAQSKKEIQDHFERILGLGKYKPEPSKCKKEKREPQHSMDMHDEGDDGW